MIRISKHTQKDVMETLAQSINISAAEVNPNARLALRNNSSNESCAMMGGGRGTEEGGRDGYTHSVSFDTTYIHDRDKAIPSSATTDNKITDKNLHTISRCLTIALSIL